MRPPLPDFRKAKLERGHVGHGATTRRCACGPTRACASAGASRRYEQRQQIEHELELIARARLRRILSRDGRRGALRAAQGTFSARAAAAPRTRRSRSVSAITAVDPVKHGLLFERFLSEARVERPRRAAGHRRRLRARPARGSARLHVRQLRRASTRRSPAVTQCFHAPTAVQDAMRALGYPAEQAFEISKRVHGARAGRVRRRDSGDRRRARRRHRAARAGGRCSTALPGFEGLARLRSTHVGGFVPLGAAARQLSARRADDDGPHDRPVRQGRSRHDRRAEVRFSRTWRAGDGAHRVRRHRAAHGQAAERCTASRTATRRRTT